MPTSFRERGSVGALIASRDWSDSPLGPPETWPPSLQTVLRLMLASRYAMWLGWGPDLAFFYNDAYREQTLGQKHPWALGRPTSIVWSEIWEQIRGRIEHVLATGDATWDEGLLLFLERNGFPEETYHTFSYSPAWDDEGRVAGLFCVVIEETDRVVGEARLELMRAFSTALSRAKSSNEVYRALEGALENDGRIVPFALMYVFDEDGGHARLAAKHFEGALPGADVVKLDAKAPWALSEIHGGAGATKITLDPSVAWPAGKWPRKPTEALVLPIPRAGHTRPAGALVLGVNPHRPDDDRYRGFLDLFVGQLAAGLEGALAFESERKRAEALAQLDHAKTAFFSNVSHEFRTPLTLMLGPTEDALASPEGSLSGESLQVVHRNELRLLKLVNALLDFSRLESGRVQARYEPTDIAAITRDLASSFRSAMERGGLRFDVDCRPPSEPVYVDQDMWEKVVLNLLSNALKFTLRGSVRVELREDRAAEQVVLRVEDTGPGIAETELPRMFERFHRVEGTPARTQEGSGIGLALVRDLVELHHGTIGVTSQVGKGTAFTVRLPLGRAHLPDDRIATATEDRARSGPGARGTAFLAEAMRWVPGAEPERQAPPSARAAPDAPRILVADDNADMRDYIVRLLGERWRVEGVGDGAAALASIERSPPDLLVSDVMMPGIDGFALVEKLRARAETRTLPIILLSARAGEEASGEGLLAGANDYLVKPFSARDLIARVASQLEIARVRREVDAQKDAQRRTVEALFANAPAGIAVVRGEQQVIEFANEMSLSIWGKTRDVIGKPLAEAMPEIKAQGFDELVRHVIRSGTPYVGDEVLVTFENAGAKTSRYLKFVYTPAPNDDGVVDGIAAFGFDVTPQVVARQRAALAAKIGRALVTENDLEGQLRTCCEALVDIGAAFARIWTYNGDNRMLELRASAGMYTHVDGGHARVPIGQFKIGRIAATRRPLLTNSVIGDREVADQAWAKREGMVAFVGYPLMVRDRLVGVLALFAKQELSSEVATAIAAVADMIAIGIDREMSERFRELFIGMLGHDLRNPLNSVNVATHVLGDVGPLNVKQIQTVQRIRTSADRMKRMITQVLDFTRSRSAGGIPLVRAPGDIHAIWAQVVEELASSHPERTIDRTSAGSGNGTWDADRLAQLFSNVVGNALTHGSADAPVEVRIDGSDADRVTCTVRNKGPAISPHLMPALFDPFKRAIQGKTEGSQGLGLGLYIAKHIAVAHGGTIEVTSDETAGTEVRIVLPRERKDVA